MGLFDFASLAALGLAVATTAPVAPSPPPAVAGVEVDCSVAFHAFANAFYPIAFTDSVSIVFHNSGDHATRSVTTRVDYLNHTYHYTDAIAAGAGGYETHVHVLKNLPYEGTSPVCTVESATFDDGSTKGAPAPDHVAS